MRGALGSGIAIVGAEVRLKFFNTAYAHLWGLEEEALKDEPHLTDIHELLRGRRRRLRAGGRVALWIRHLVWCALAPADVAIRSRWLHLDGELDMEPVTAAREVLGVLLAGQAEGLCAPLPFFPEASTEYARVMRSGRGGDPLRAARGKWLEGWNRPGEGDDPYHRLAWRGRDPLADPRFVELARAVADPMLGAS